MEKQILGDKPIEKRKIILQDSADKIEEQTYYKGLNDVERKQHHEDVAKNQYDIYDDERELKEISKDFKTRIKENKKANAQIYDDLRRNSQKITAKVYLVADQEEGMMGVYTAEGSLISSRPLTQEERQYTILSKAN